MRSDTNTKSETRALITELATRAFLNHKIKAEGPGQVWRCGQNTSICSFRVAILPGAIPVWGDVGTMMVNAGGAYDLAWLRGAIRSPHYLLEKTNLKKDCFYPGEFKGYLTERIKELAEDLKDSLDQALARDRLEAAKSDHAAAKTYNYDVTAYHHYMESNPNAEIYETVYGYDSDAYWLVEALKTFIRLYDQIETTSNTSDQGVAGSLSSGMAGDEAV